MHAGLKHGAAIGMIIGIIPVAVSANIVVDFRESAPKDRFTVTNTGNCDLSAFRVEIDLTNSRGGLIFDTTDQGAGVEVFQPYETVAGAEHIKTASAVVDGDRGIALDLRGLPKGKSVAFTIDVDDTLASSANGQIMVNGGEIAGAVVSVSGDIGGSKKATFGGNSRAEIAMAGCTS